MKPTTNEKSLKDWEFGELVTYATWHIVQNIVHGNPLSSSVHHILQLALQWKGECDEKKV